MWGSSACEEEDDEEDEDEDEEGEDEVDEEEAKRVAALTAMLEICRADDTDDTS